MLLVLVTSMIKRNLIQLLSLRFSADRLMLCCGTKSEALDLFHIILDYFLYVYLSKLEIYGSKSRIMMQAMMSN
jgi:hypothetical protein